jgi:hypothetical protein
MACVRFLASREVGWESLVSRQTPDATGILNAAKPVCGAFNRDGSDALLASRSSSSGAGAILRDGASDRPLDVEVARRVQMVLVEAEKLQDHYYDNNHADNVEHVGH